MPPKTRKISKDENFRNSALTKAINDINKAIGEMPYQNVFKTEISQLIQIRNALERKLL